MFYFIVWIFCISGDDTKKRVANNKGRNMRVTIPKEKLRRKGITRKMNKHIGRKGM